MRNKFFLVGCFFLVMGIVGLLILDSPLRASQPVTLTSPEGAPLTATYYPGTASRGIILFEGFGADQHMMRPMARDLNAAGWHVFTFDYSGHGASTGSLGYDNAATDRLAGQAQTAMQEFQRLSGLDASQIVWLGHSLGARVALQSAVLGPLRPQRLVLIGAQVNLVTNEQAEFFTGTQDVDLPWVQSLDLQNPSVPILLVIGSWDDILTPQAATKLMMKLCGEETTYCAGEFAREFVSVNGVFHNYEIYSPRLLSSVWVWLAQADAPIPSTSGLRLGLWVSFLLGVFLVLMGLLRAIPRRPLGDEGITVSNPKKLVWGRVWLWLPALPLSGGIMYLYLLIPLPSPAFNLIYGGFLGGYGFLIGVLYLFGRMPGVTGSLRGLRINSTALTNGWLLAAAFNVMLFSSLAFFYRSGIGMVPPVGDRFLWIFIFMPLTALGFWLGMLESQALSRAAPDKPHYRLWTLLISLLPFYLYIGLLISLASVSGVLSAFTGLVILAVGFMQSEITYRLTSSAILAAVLQAILVYMLILPSGALFTPL